MADEVLNERQRNLLNKKCDGAMSGAKVQMRRTCDGQVFEKWCVGLVVKGDRILIVGMPCAASGDAASRCVPFAPFPFDLFPDRQRGRELYR